MDFEGREGYGKRGGEKRMEERKGQGKGKKRERLMKGIKNK